MAEGGTPDQDIIIKYTVDADAALARNAEVEAAIEVVKKQLIDLSAQGSTAMRTMADSMKKVYEEMKMATAKAEFPGGPGAFELTKAADLKDYLEPYKKDIETFNTAVNESLRRANAEVVAVTQEGAKQRVLAERAVTEGQKAAQQEYVMAWSTGTKNMSAAAQNFGVQVQDMKAKIVQAAEQSGRSITQIGSAFKAAGQPIAVVDQALRELNTTASATTGIFSRVGGAIQVALGIGLEQIVMKTVRAIIDGFKQITEAGFEYAQSLIKLQIGTQLLQRAGLNITMRETLDLVSQLNQEFPLFTRKSIVEGIGYMQILSQNLGLAKDQMSNLSKVSAALAVILGKDVGEATKEIALFLSSGYGEALQRAGILASKASVEHELLAMGITEGYNSVDQATRAQAGYNVIMQQAGTLVEKARDIQNNYAYALRQTKTDWENLSNEVGARAAPALSVFARGLQFVIKLLNLFATQVSELVYYLSRDLGNLALRFELLWKTFGPNATLAVKDFGKAWKAITEEVLKDNKEIDDAFIKLEQAIISGKGKAEAIKNLQEVIDKAGDLQKAAAGISFGDIYSQFSDDAIGAGNASEEAAAKISQATEGLHDKLLDEQKNFSTESKSLWTDYQRDIEKIFRDALVKRGELYTDYLRTIEQIDIRLTEDIYNENLKYQASVADAQRDYASKREDIETKYRNNELKAQKDFEEKMRRLREDFIMNMEDALRERDARQVLRLIRQFNLNQDRLERERDQEREERQREYRQELKDLEKQRDERLATLAREHQARLIALERQAQLERDQAWRKYQQEMADLRARISNEITERGIAYKQQLTDLQVAHEARYKEILDALVREYNMTGAMLESTMALYRSKYGVGGELEGIYKYAAQLIQGLNDMLAYAAKVAAGGWGQTGPLPTSPIGQQWSGPPVRVKKKKYETGGSFVATSPTIAEFGEVPELVTAIPINQLNKTPSVGKLGSKNGKVAIELFLSPDLEARIIDKTLDINADVMVDIQRRR